MFILKKVITPFILPPGIFIVTIFLIGGYLLLKRKKVIGGLTCLVAGCMWACSITPVYHQVFRHLESGLQVPNNINGDIIIVLAGGAGTGNDKMERIFAAADLQKELSAPILVAGDYTGNGRNPGVPIYKEYLTRLNVPPTMIFADRVSRDTMENAKNSLIEINRKGYRNPIVVTSAYHMKRALIAFEKVGVAVRPFPVGFKYREDIVYAWYDYLPGNFVNMMVGLKEYLGLIYYKAAH